MVITIAFMAQGPILSILHVLSHSTFKQPGVVLQMKTWRLRDREAELFAQNHTFIWVLNEDRFFLCSPYPLLPHPLYLSPFLLLFLPLNK